MLAVAPSSPAAIVRRVNADDVQASDGQRLFRFVYQAERADGYPAGWVAACAAGRDFRWSMLDAGVRSVFGLGALESFASMYASAVFGIPASCWTVSDG